MSPIERITVAALDRFDDAFSRHDVDAVMAAMSADCIFEDTSPPDGARHEGQAEVRKAWQAFFASAPSAEFETEERIIAGDRAVVLWTYRWAASNAGGGGHVRGVDVFQIMDGKVAHKQSYVKG